MLSFIDRQFKAYGIKAYGEETMDRLSDSEIEKARCYAFSVLDERTKKYGRQPKGTVESIFCQKVAEMLGIENQSLSEYIREYQRNTLKAHISILRPLA